MDMLSRKLRFVRSGGTWHVLWGWETGAVLCGTRLASGRRKVRPLRLDDGPVCRQCIDIAIGDPHSRRNKPPSTGPLVRKLHLHKLTPPPPVKPLAGQLTFGGSIFDGDGNLHEYQTAAEAAEEDE